MPVPLALARLRPANMKFANRLIVNFNGDHVPYVARLQHLTGMPGRYLIDGEIYTFSFMLDNFTILSKAAG